MTIVQVTHSDVNARYAHRIVEMRDGWLGAQAQAPEKGRET
jgi:ABC-type lipoprotein export system ATPase subunit